MSKYFFNKDFFLLWLGQSVSRMGDGAGFIAVMWWVQSESGPLALGMLAMAKGLTATVLSPFAGVLADRLDRKGIIVSADVTRGVIYCILGFLAFNGSLTLPILTVLSCLSVACGQVFFPAVTASIPLMVPNSGLERANAMSRFSSQLVTVAGYAVGGVLVALFGVPTLLLANGISFLCSAVSEMFIHIPHAGAGRQRLSPALIVSDIRDGIAYIRDNHVLIRMIGLSMVLNFFFAPLMVLMPVFVSDHLGADSAFYGYFLSALMTGGLLATIVLSVSRWVQNNLWLVKWGIMFQGLLMVLFTILPVNMWSWQIGLLFAFGWVNTIINIYFQTIIQRTTRPEYMGKVFSLLETVSGALTPMAQGLSGAAASVFSLPAIYMVCSGCLTAAGTTVPFIKGIDHFMAVPGGDDMEEEESPVRASN